jgi:hypothetical protein
MSVFKVHVNYPAAQGYLDLNPATASQGFLGNQMQPSKQRTIFVTGPNRRYRELFDGQTFTDCNYWKRFAFPQAPYETAFIEVMSDDGSVFSDIASENTFPYIYSPYSVLIADTFATNFIDIVALGGVAQFVQITNNGTMATQDITVQLNGSATAVFTLGAGDTQVFNVGDLAITKLAFDGGIASTTLQIILSVTVQCLS